MAYHKCAKKPEMPSIPRRVWNLSKAVAVFVADGCKTVSKEEYRSRLAICDGCERREGAWCRHKKCGCRIAIKAKGRAWKCPLGKWDPPEAMVVSVKGLSGIPESAFWCDQSYWQTWEYCDLDIPEWVAVCVENDQITIAVGVEGDMIAMFRGPVPADLRKLDEVRIPRVEGQSGECWLSAIET